MKFDSQEVAWADISVSLFGTAIKIRGVKYSKETEKEAIYTSGNDPVGIQTGNSKYEGSLKMLKNQLDALNDAAKLAGFRDITEVPYQVFFATVNYKLAFGRPMRTDVLQGLSISKFEKGMDQNAKLMEIELPFMFLGLTEK